MAFFLLLAFLCAAAFTYAAPGRGQAQAVARAGFGLLALGLLAQLVLGYHLSQSLAQLFYLARYMLAAAWLGLAALLLIEPGHPWLPRGIWALLAASAASLVLVGLARITEAQDWYQLSAPAYGQIHDLLATNRPARWGGATLSALGLLALAETALTLVRRGRGWPAAALAAGAVALAAPLLWPPRQPSLAFYLVELAAPVLLYIGMSARSRSKK